MQNHQPYYPIAEEDIRIRVTSDKLDPRTLGSVTSFVQGLYDADRMLGALADFIDERERPTVLLFFGDHLPPLGHGLTAYIQSGFLDPDDQDSTEQRMRQYSTPFIIYSNRELDSSVLSKGADNHVSTYYLLPLLAEMTGFRRTPYMNLLLDHFPTVPFYNNRLNQPRTDDIEKLSRALALTTYDRLVGNRYTLRSFD